MTLMSVILLKITTLYISNQTNQRYRKLFRGTEIASFHFLILFLLFKLHLPELHDSVKQLHKADDLSGMLHGAETRDPL